MQTIPETIHETYAKETQIRNGTLVFIIKL